MTRKTKTFRSKISRNRYIKKLKSQNKMILKTSEYYAGIRYKKKQKYSLTWWEKTKR